MLWSTAGLYVRFLDLELWTLQAWRALFGALSLLVILVAMNGRRTLGAVAAIGRPGLIAVPLTAISMLSYVAALKFTTVANVLVVYATVPLVAAAIAFVWLGERLSRRALVASALVLAGIAVMAGSATRIEDVTGDALAFAMTLTFAVLLVMARRHPTLSMASVNALGAMLCAAICFPLATGPVPDPTELLILAIFGATTSGLAYLLFLVGGRDLPSGEAGLIGLLDVVFGPLWVWLAFSEQPGPAALTGGAIVLAALLWFLAGGARRGRIAARGPATRGGPAQP